MDENKNKPSSEDKVEEIAEEVIEEVKETAEEVIEEATEVVEDVIEEVQEAAKDAAELTKDAAETVKEVAEDVSRETTEAVKNAAEAVTEKKSRGGMIGIIAGVILAVIIAAALAFTFLSGKNDAGTGNLYSLGFASVKGNNVYHVNFADYMLYKTNLKTGVSEKISDDMPVYINNYKNKTYYLITQISEDLMSATYVYKQYVDGVNDIIIFEESEAISTPQISGGYIYYMKSVPEYNSGYSSRVYRAKLQEGAVPELCMDVLCNSYYVDGKYIYYGDVDLAHFVKAEISKAVKLASESPLESGVLRHSAELEAETIVETILAFPTIYKGNLYYVDTYNSNELCAISLKTGEIKYFNNGTPASVYNIYGDYIYYYSLTDFSFYRMKLDGSDVTKVSPLNYFGYSILENDKFLILDYTEEKGQFISVCDLDGNALTSIDFVEQIYYDESAIPEEELENAEAEEDAIDTTIDLE